MATGRHISDPYSTTAVGSNAIITFVLLHMCFIYIIKVSSVEAFLAVDLSTFLGNKSTSKGHFRREDSTHFVFSIELRCFKRFKKLCAYI